MTKQGRIVAILIATWFATALTAAAFGVFSNTPNRVGVEVAIASLAPILLFTLWYARSEAFRRFALALNPQTLTLAHSWRILGFLFVLLEAKGLLPAVFALPAGYGDMAIGATATLMAWKFAVPQHRGSFIAWQFLGMADLVMAVGLGTTARLLSPVGPGMGPMTVLPLSLVPTFFVPLLFLLHLVSIAQARRWSSQPVRPRVAEAIAEPLR